MHQNDQNYYAFKPLPESTIQIDLSSCKTLGELHLLLKAKFGFPEYYGENWSALWDCLDGLFEDEGEIKVEIFGYSDMGDEMQKGCQIMLEIFKQAAETMPNVHFTVF